MKEKILTNINYIASIPLTDRLSVNSPHALHPVQLSPVGGGKGELECQICSKYLYLVVKNFLFPVGMS